MLIKPRTRKKARHKRLTWILTDTRRKQFSYHEELWCHITISQVRWKKLNKSNAGLGFRDETCNFNSTPKTIWFYPKLLLRQTVDVCLPCLSASCVPQAIITSLSSVLRLEGSGVVKSIHSPPPLYEWPSWLRLFTPHTCTISPCPHCLSLLQANGSE